MRERILEFVQALRGRGVDVSVAETMDAVSAVAAAGVEREVLRETLAVTLVKDEADRPAFDVLFDAMFPLVGGAAGPGRRRRRVPAGGGAAATGAGHGEGDGERRQPREEESDRRQGVPRAARPGERRTPREETGDRRSRVIRARRLLALPFAEFTSRDVEEARALVRELAARLRGRLARRERKARRGRLDFRRTIRGSLPTGGVPVRPRWRRRRPGRPDLIALCDLSGSVAAASDLCLGLLAPARPHFRRMHLFAYVDRLVPVSIEEGHVAPDGTLDLHARSDFGRVLADLWERREILTRSALVLVLGDARNNRRPPRADLLRAIAERVQRVVWLVPEPRLRWDTGDSVLRLYAPASTAVFECTNLEALVRAVRRTL
jgi:uncharacterized protein